MSPFPGINAHRDGIDFGYHPTKTGWAWFVRGANTNNAGAAANPVEAHAAMEAALTAALTD